MNHIPSQGQSSIKYDYGNKEYIVNSKDRCPLLNPDSKHTYMTSYCSDFDGIFGNKELCNEWWAGEGGTMLQNRDRLAVNFCTQDKYKNLPECACINAKPQRDLPEATAWIFDTECGDPTKNAYHTQNMKNVTWQDCRQYWDINDVYDSSLRNMSMEQTCNMNFPDAKPLPDVNPPNVNPSGNPSDVEPNTPPGVTPFNPNQQTDENNKFDFERLFNQKINGVKLIYLLLFFILIILVVLYLNPRSHENNKIINNKIIK
jgi:hypothetical protein